MSDEQIWCVANSEGVEQDYLTRSEAVAKAKADKYLTAMTMEAADEMFDL
jgi:hypothetical protein